MSRCQRGPHCPLQGVVGLPLGGSAAPRAQGPHLHRKAPAPPSQLLRQLEPLVVSGPHGGLSCGILRQDVVVDLVILGRGCPAHSFSYLQLFCVWYRWGGIHSCGSGWEVLRVCIHSNWATDM